MFFSRPTRQNIMPLFLDITFLQYLSNFLRPWLIVSPPIQFKMSVSPCGFLVVRQLIVTGLISLLGNVLYTKGAIILRRAFFGGGSRPPSVRPDRFNQSHASLTLLLLLILPPMKLFMSSAVIFFL